MTPEEAHALLLRGYAVTLNSTVVPEDLCRLIISSHSNEVPPEGTQAAQLAASLISDQPALATRLLSRADKDRLVKVMDRMAVLPFCVARHMADIIIQHGGGIPHGKTLDKFVKMAVTRRAMIVSMARAHLKEAVRRKKAEDEERHWRASRERMTPEQRAEFCRTAMARLGNGLS